MVPVALTVIGAIGLAHWVAIPMGVFAGVMIGAALGASVLVLLPRSAGAMSLRCLLGTIALLLLVFGCAGLRYRLVDDIFGLRHIVRYCRDEPRLATVRGVVVGEPYTSSDNSTFAAFNPSSTVRWLNRCF